MTHFSDSVALSYRIDETSAVFWMLNQIAMAVIQLASLGFLVRGAVTVGRLHHSAETLVGPAMVAAYQMESKEAIYPRVIIDPVVLEVAKQHPSPDHHPMQESNYVQKMLAHATDGRFWINFISYEAFLGAGLDPDNYPLYLCQIGKMVQTGLLHTSSSVVQKHMWLHPYYIAEIERFSEFPAQQDELHEKQRLYISNLPRFDAEKLAADRRIACEDAKALDAIRCSVSRLLSRIGLNFFK